MYISTYRYVYDSRASAGLWYIISVSNTTFSLKKRYLYCLKKVPKKVPFFSSKRYVFPQKGTFFGLK